MKIGIIDVGGGLRGMYAAGVLDRCLDSKTRFEVSIGVSAGSANLVSFGAGQRGRNYRFYDVYAQRPEYMSFRNFVKTGSLFGMEYIYGTLTNTGGEYPLDYEAFRADPCDFWAVATDGRTGKPRYFAKDEIRKDHYEAIAASCSLPGVGKPLVMGGVPYFDGGLSDSIPWRKAFELGCDRVVILLTRPKSYRRRPTRQEAVLSSALASRYPGAAAGLRFHAQQYNEALDEACRLEEKGKVLIVSPDSIGRLTTLSRDSAALEVLYQKGYADGTRVAEWVAMLRKEV